MRAACLGLAAAVAGLCLTLGAVVQADPAPPAEAADTPEPQPAKHEVVVLVLHATNSGKGIDERIRDMPELRSPPFSSYDSYELISEKTLPLKKSQARSVRLPNGRVLKTELKDVLPERFVRLSAAINQPGGKDFLPLLEVKAKLGQAFIVAGQSFRNGILVLVIRVNEIPPPATGAEK
jgi:hypothetical protein